jgi:hypothetical protein
LASCNYIGVDHKSNDITSQAIKLDTLDKSSILYALFKPEIKEWCLWKPTKADSVFPVSDDGLCHTRVDSIYKFKQDTAEMALLLLGTYACVNGEPEFMQMSAPLVSAVVVKRDSERKWIIDSYKKAMGFFGSFGEKPQGTIQKLGRWTFFEIGTYNSNMGLTDITSVMYCLPSLKQSLELKSSYCEQEYEGSLYDDNENFETSFVDQSTDNQCRITVTVKKWKGKSTNFSYKKIDYVLNDSCVFSSVNKTK